MVIHIVWNNTQRTMWDRYFKSAIVHSTFKNNGIFIKKMKSRKIIFPFINRLEDKLHFYIKDRQRAESEYLETFEEFLHKFHMKTFFHCLHDHLTSQMIKHYKKYSILEDGIYILLKGQVVYAWNKNKHDRQPKQHLFNLAKNGSFSILMENPLIVDPLLDLNYSVLIQDNFSVLECQQKSHMTLDDCVIVKLSEKALEQTNFYRIKNQRINLCQQAYFPGFPYKTPFFSLNSSLHHTFKQKKANFHHKLILNDIGIILKGSIKVTGKNHCLSEKYGILLPLTQYQVMSSQAIVLIIEKNPTLTFLNENLKESYRKILLRKKEQKQKEDKILKRKIEKYSSSHQSVSSMHVELKKRKKQIKGFSKDYQNFCILSMYSCKQNLKYAKKANKDIKKLNESERNSSILFSLKNPHQRYSSSFQENKGKDFHNLSFLKEQMMTSQKQKQISLIKRYQSCSKVLYNKFVNSRQHKTQKK